MDDSRSAGVLVSETTVSAQSRPEPAHCQPTRPRKAFGPLDSLNLGRTGVQAVELATGLNPERYVGKLGLPARGPLLDRLEGSPLSVREFHPKVGFDSVHGIYQMFRLALALLRHPGLAAELGKNGRAYGSTECNFQRLIGKTDQKYTELLHSRGAE